MFAKALDLQFARDVRAGLTRTEGKTLPCRYFYDDVGSALFEAITRLPEYGLTRADMRILKANAAEIVSLLPGNVVTVELGSGSGAKTRHILEQLHHRQVVVYYPVDLSADALAHCVQELSSIAAVIPLEQTYLDGLYDVSKRRAHSQTLLVLFLGSNIGNFEPESAIEFLTAVRQCLEPGDALLLGTDMVKPVEQLINAYDDPTGVTAAFNLNILARLNRELDADFDLRQFEHIARYNATAQRIEMHLRARTYQIASIRKADLIVDFAPNETICTEVCHKFYPEQICVMAQTARFRLVGQWTDEDWPFAESLLVAV